MVFHRTFDFMHVDAKLMADRCSVGCQFNADCSAAGWGVRFADVARRQRFEQTAKKAGANFSAPAFEITQQRNQAIFADERSVQKTSGTLGLQ